MIVFGLFWSALTLAFDGFVVVPTIRQILATRYPSTEGTMISAKVTRHDSDEGYTYGVAMRYTYRVSGREYEGERYRYQSASSSDSAWAHAAVAEHPPGSRTTVYYNPVRPEDAVLVPGVNGSDLFLVMFITPFNAVMLAFWFVGFGGWRRRWFKPVAGGVRIVSHLRRTRARLNTLSPLATAIVGMALAAFVAIFPVAFLGGGFHPSLRTVLAAWGFVVAVGVSTWVWQWKKILAGDYDLILHEMEGRLELPPTCGRKQRVTIPVSRVQAAFVDKIEKPSSDGDKCTPLYAPTLRVGDGAGVTEKLAEWYEQDKAAAFVAWLNEKLPVRPSTPVGRQRPGDDR